MRAPIRLGIAVLAVAALAGCGANEKLAPQISSAPGSPAADEAEVNQAMVESPDLVEDGVFAGLDETAMDASTGFGAASPDALIHPLRYWREIKSIERRVEVTFSEDDADGRPTRALVVIHKQLRGIFNIAAGVRGDGEPSPTDARDPSIKLVQKRLADHWIRKLVLQRVRPDGDAETDRIRWHWKIVGTSGVEVTSNLPDVKPTLIKSVHIRSAGFSTTITDPLALQRLGALLKFEAETEVGITVTTERPDDVVVLMHRERRFVLKPNGDNTYSGVWQAPLREGFHHLGLNALAHGTLFDDEAPYSSQAWILPYVVRGAEPAAALEP